MNAIPPCLEGRWIHAREEDTERVRTYRPSNWPFTRSRLARQILEFMPGYRIVSRAGGPADARVSREGRWEMVPGEPLVLRLEWLDTSETALIEVITCSPDVLQLKVTEGSIE